MYVHLAEHSHRGQFQRGPVVSVGYIGNQCTVVSAGYIGNKQYPTEKNPNNTLACVRNQTRYLISAGLQLLASQYYTSDNTVPS